MESRQSPQSMAEALLAALGEPDGARREQAIERAAVAADPESLVGLLGKHEDAVRRNAALAALERGGGRSLPALIAALRESDEEVVMFAATALAGTRDASAIPHLARLLRHADLNVAQAAIDALGKLRATSAAPLVEEMLDADPWLRFAAANALGEIGHAGSVPALVRATQDPALADLAIEALGKIGSCEAIDALAEFIASDRFELAVCLLALGRALAAHGSPGRLAGCANLARLAGSHAAPLHARLRAILTPEPDGDGAGEQHGLRDAAIVLVRGVPLPQLFDDMLNAAADPTAGESLMDAAVFLGTELQVHIVAALAHAIPEVRLFACTAAGVLGLVDAGAAIEQLVDDPVAEVRAGALRTLTQLRWDQALPVMLRRLGDTEESVRAAAVRALGRMDAKSVTVAMLGNPEVVRQHAAAALEVMRANPYSGQRGFIEAHLRDEREHVRRAAVAALAGLGGAEVVEVLEPLLRDTVRPVRVEVIRALGRYRSQRAIELLFEQFQHDPQTRGESLAAIARAGDGAAARRLTALLPMVGQQDRLAIIDALGAMADPGTEPVLAGLLCHPQPEVRCRAVVALGGYGTDGAVTRLAQAARDSDARVRLAALESLASAAGRPAAAEAIERLCMDPIPAIASLARRSLRG